MSFFKPPEITPNEVAQRFRSLDQQGREAVLAVLQAELDRCGVVIERTLFERWFDGVGDEILPFPMPTKEK